MLISEGFGMCAMGVFTQFAGEWVLLVEVDALEVEKWICVDGIDMVGGYCII
jgi:hypothetical protein